MVYSVKSGYQVALNDKFNDRCSASNPNSKWWLRLWNLNIPPKVRIFLWQVCNNDIPSLLNLQSRKIISNTTCSRCKKGVEDSAHALLWCPKAKKVWYKTTFWSIMEKFIGYHSLDLIRWLLDNVKKDDIEAWCMVLWSSWLNRNNFIHNNKVIAPDELLNWVFSFLKEFQNSRIISTYVVSSCYVIYSSSWSPPPLGSLKLNIDVAMKANFSHIRIGEVIRNDKGEVVSALSKHLDGSFSADLREYLALREGLLLAKRPGFSVRLVEADAVNVVSVVNSNRFLSSIVGPVISDVKALFRDVGVINSQAIPRNRNVVAHTLASLAFSSYEDKTWLFEKPDCIAYLL
ncbi:hypothetical protein Dsin_006504 [Dipteronia sinensis]|uniref:Reverse transcriptase zinc-binding domain-containing protein n=1 Tax=Dipteronia sinensis TaxID=43782 RepID=A0AAE0EG79_9ROSI|nr:hypothetical protein Dsin_006504 [Dipteronia sinensis]